MLLESKTAVVYGGGGAIGGAVAQAFAERGAHVIVAGRTGSSLERVSVHPVRRFARRTRG